MKHPKRVLAWLLTLTMLLAICPVLPAAAEEGQEMAVSHYFGNAVGDWETWGGNTNLVLNFNGVNPSLFKTQLGNPNYPLEWYFTVGGNRYLLQPTSEYTFGESSMLMRFPTISEGFFPVTDMEYSMFIEVYQKGERIYWGNIDHVVSRIARPVVQGATYIQPGNYGSGMENWRSSDAYDGYATQILFVVNDSDAGVDLKALIKNKARYTWTLHFADADECFNLQIMPSTNYAFSNTNVIYRFEPCVCNTPFVPVANKTYHIGLTVRDGDGDVVYYSPSYSGGYTLREDPVVPADLTKTITWNVDGVITTSQCMKGRTPEYPGGTPVKAADAQYTYVFAGWLPALGAVTEDTSYTAVFEKAVNSYPVTWRVDGKEYTTYVQYGETPTCPVTPEKEAGDGYLYRFTGFSPALSAVTGEATYTAQFEQVEIGDHLMLSVEKVTGHIGEEVTVQVKAKNLPACGIYGYSFLLEYDPDCMTLLQKSVPLSYGYSGVKTVEPGKLRFQWTDIETPLSEGAAVASVTFRMTAEAENGNTGLKIRFEEPIDLLYSLNMTDFSMPAQECYGIPGKIEMLPFIAGDLNGDGIVSIADVTTLLNYLSDPNGFGGYLDGMLDVTGDGVVSILDVSRLLQHLSDNRIAVYSFYTPLTHTVTYTASYGGKVEGETTQTVPTTGVSETVKAVPVSKLYRFAYWSDGELSASRSDAVKKDTTLEAVFEKVPLELDIADLYIETEGAKKITSRDTYIGMTLSVAGSSHPEYNVSGYTGQIRGRGNSSWDYFQGTKPSYRIKFESKHQLLGIGNGADKDWILLTTYSDLSILRNPAAWEMGRMFEGVSFTSSYGFVHVYLNGEYRGLYILCDQVESGSARIDIQDELDDLDKGYLIEMDSRASGEGVQGIDWFNIVGGQKPFVIKSEVNSREECNFAKNLVQQLHDALMSGNRDRIEQVCYIDSLIDMYIIEEITKDRDVGFASFYFYRDAGDKFRFGAPWDFDLGLGNDSAYPYTNGLVSDGNDGNIWYNRLIRENWFREAVALRLQELRPYMTYLSEELYAMRDALEVAAAQNYERWRVLGTNTFLSPSEVARLKTFDAHVEYLVNWIEERYNWLCGYYEDDLPVER